MFTNVGSMGRFKKRVSVNFIQDITDGLVAHWKLDEPSGTNYVDSAGSNDLTSSGSPVSVTGQVDLAREFSGSNYAFRNSSSGLNNTNLTWSAWVWSDVNGKYLFHLDDRFGGVGFHVWTEASSRVTAYYGDVFPPVWHTSDGSIPSGEWVHVAITTESSGGDVKHYFNGVLDTTQASDQIITFNSSSPRVGIATGYDSNSGGFSTNKFDGKMDEVRLYNRVLDATEILDIYNFSK
jgi:hypothetical protein